MKDWAKKLDQMWTTDSNDVDLTEDEIREMMSDIGAGANEGYKMRIVTKEELAEIEAMFEPDRTIH